MLAPPVGCILSLFVHISYLQFLVIGGHSTKIKVLHLIISSHFSFNDNVEWMIFHKIIFIFSLDYNNFVLGNPTTTLMQGQCTSDVVKISSASSSGTSFFPTPFDMCGTLTGNHCKHFRLL